MPNLVFERLTGPCPRIGQFVTSGVYFTFLFLPFDVLAYLPRS